jgi:hypothetical protein
MQGSRYDGAAMSFPSPESGPAGPAEPDPVVSADNAAFDPDDRVYEHMSLRGPALVVLGIAVFIVVVGVVASALASGGDTTLSIHRITIPDGTSVPLTPAATAMRSVVNAGQPPADILGNLAVPSGSVVIRTLDVDQSAGQFDRAVVFRTGLSSDQVGDVYRTLLPRLGWKVTDTGSPATGSAPGTVLLFKRGSGDSYYWEVGATVSPTTSTGSTTFSVELLELPDDS